MKTLFVAVLLFAAQGFAGGTLNMKVDVTNSVSNYVANRTLGSFSATNTSGTVTGVMTGTGDFAGVNQSLNQTISEEIGVTIQGYSNMTITPVEGEPSKVKLSEDSNLTKSSVTSKISYTVDAVITNGSWVDYLAGKTITVMMTETGNRQANAAMAASMANSFEAALASQLGRNVTANVRLSSPTNSTTCEISKEKAVCRTSDLRMILTVGIY